MSGHLEGRQEDLEMEPVPIEQQMLRREILLVEDSDSDARLIQRALLIAGVANHVRHIANGRQAMFYLRGLIEDCKLLPSVLLLDLKLPSMNGFEILSWIQQQDAFSKTLRVVLTELNFISNVRKAYALGAHSFLGKPIGQEDLHELITVFPEYWVLTINSTIPAEPSVRR